MIGRQEYLASLGAFLADRSEASLNRAYDLGRRALSSGLGILDVVALHEEARLASVSRASDRLEIEQAARQYLLELLSPFEMTFRGYREANQELGRVNATLMEQKRALEVLNQELESFSYSVSHDLRAPLRIIDGYAAALLEDYADELAGDAIRYLRGVRDSAHHMADLIEALLGLARVTRCDLRRAPVDLSGLVRRIVDDLRATAPDRSIEVNVAPDIHASGDPRLLGVALQNLLGNAFKFTSKRQNARIEFGVQTGGPRTVYFVRDNGAGFDMKYADKLFGAFRRLHSNKEFEGTGIGLATVKRVIHRHGGEIWAHSEADWGATFFFTLGEQGPE